MAGAQRCHGGAGGEFGPDAASARLALAHHHRAGTTSLLGSLVSNSHEALAGGVTTCAAMVARGDLAGIHLEGPFLSMERRGAQNPAALCDVDAGLLEALVEAATSAGAPGAPLALAPHGDAIEGPGSYSKESGVATPAITPATTLTWRPWHLKGRPKWRRGTRH